MSRHRFVCTNCGAEYWLQAWKAVCPSCKMEYTLEKYEGKKSKWVITKSHLLSSTALSTYVAYSALFPTTSVYSYIQPLPIPVLQALTLVMAILVFSGSSPALWASAVFGASLTIVHLQGIYTVNILGAVIGAFILITAVAYLRYLHCLKKHTEKSVDARSMSEYSGWAG